jgi:hypothetical protein
LRIFKNAWFQRFARKEKITDRVLVEAITRAEKGLIDADLGGNVIKQRIARQGKGKSSGYRSIIIFQKDDKAFFVYCFGKSDRSNLRKDEESAFKKLSRQMLNLSDGQIEQLIQQGNLTEIELDE